MTVKQINRSHRMAFLVVLLIVAVALTTALVLAGERPASLEKQTATPQSFNHFSADSFPGSPIC